MTFTGPYRTWGTWVILIVQKDRPLTTYNPTVIIVFLGLGMILIQRLLNEVAFIVLTVLFPGLMKSPTLGPDTNAGRYTQVNHTEPQQA